MKTVITRLLSFVGILALAAMACNMPGVEPPAQNSGAIGGTITADLNGNGTSDSEEGPLDNVIVSLNGCGEARTALSGADGSFSFSGLPTGVCILEVTKGGWTYSASYPTPGYPIPVTADASQPTALAIFMSPADQTQAIPVTGDPTATQLPTDVPLAATPDATATPGQAMVSATDRDVNCRFGPSTKYSPIDALLKGKTVPILGKTEDSSWWQVDGPSYGSGKCFVSASVTQTSGDLSTVPVVQAPQAYVTDVQISVKVLYVSSCDDVEIELTGSISANGPTSVKYRLIVDGSYSWVSDYMTLEFTEAGELPLRLAGYADIVLGVTQCGDYTLEFQVTAPNAISAYDDFMVTYQPQGSAPEIQKVYWYKERRGGRLVIHQDISFKDADGDVTTADWEFISATKDIKDISEGGALIVVDEPTVTSSSAEQKAGTTIRVSWNCLGKKGSITGSVTLVDKEGHRSTRVDKIVCD